MDLSSLAPKAGFRLNGVAIENYRGFDQRIVINGFRKFNFFIGPNNSGKSTVLNALIEIKKWQNNYKNGIFNNRNIDKHIFKRNEPTYFSVLFDISQLNYVFSFTGADVKLKEEIARALLRNIYNNDPIEVRYSIEANGFDFYIDGKSIIERVREIGRIEVYNPNSYKTTYHIADIRNILTNLSGGNQTEWPGQIVRAVLGNLTIELPEVFLIPAKRKIDASDLSEFDFSGRSLVKKLASLEKPEYNNLLDKEKFTRINAFFQDVIEDSNAYIEIPHTQNYILVNINGKTLKLSELGTGVEELINMCSSCTIINNSIVCIEEPETHIHPRLQRKFVDYLNNNTDNYYFISTHSPSLIDAKIGSIYSMYLDGTSLKTKNSSFDSDTFEIVSRMGFRASDILQANYILWVEGPSDRIYFKDWLNKINPRLREGIEYTIMFYGGKLLSHITAEADQLANELIRIVRINRNCGIVMDSDRKKKSDSVNNTKQRVRDEFIERNLYTWISDRREIENYIPIDIINSYIEKKYEIENYFDSKNTEFKDLTTIFVRNKKTSISKIDLANYVKDLLTEMPSDVELRQKIHEVSSRIEEANHLR